MLMKDGQDFRPVTKACWDIPSRLDDLDNNGLEHQMLSATPILFQWHQPAHVALDVSKYFNDSLMELVSCPQAAGRLHALCQVPLQNVSMACEELSRAKQIGHKGVQIGNHVGNKDLDDEGLIAFLKHCADLDMPVLIHPWDMANPDNRLTKYMMGWTVGMPMETHLSIVSMILGGAFDRLPTSLRVCFAHGGGAFPHLLGRLENAWLHREIARGKSEHPPSHYLDRFTVDSAVFGQRELRLLVDTFGPDRIMLGSDYPFPLGEQQIGNVIRSSEFLPDEEKTMIMRTNATKFFNLEASEAWVRTEEKMSFEGLRVDPLDGQSYTFEQMMRFYSQRHQAIPIQSYWHKRCKKVESLGSTSTPWERRVDPSRSEGVYTFNETLKHYAEIHLDIPVRTYWELECIPVPHSSIESATRLQVTSHTL